jgi:peptidoglycan/xylan/chitin deacetylase (PgdA/CDA1 family)
VLTQTLHLADDVGVVLTECARILRPGGVLLATVPCVTRIDDEGGFDGDFWRLTEASVRKLFAGVFAIEAFDVTPYGNVKACTAFLYGLSAEELAPADLNHVDPAFPVVIAIRAVKPEESVESARNVGSAANVGSGFSRTLLRHKSSTRESKAAILAYHRVAELAPDSHGLCTPPGVFRQHMACIRRECSPISLNDLLRAAAAGNIPDRAVAVTFDDGYLDALTLASPILTELGVPATFFVNTDRLDEEHERWWDMLERIFSCEGTLPPLLALAIGDQNLRMPTTTAEERAVALASLSRIAWPMDANGRVSLVADVVAWSQTTACPRSSHRVLTGGEIRVLASRPGHAIGGHTVHHLALTTQPLETKRREIVDDKIALERLLERPVDLFSYPYGDFDVDSRTIAAEAGFRAAVTIEDGRVSAGTNRLLFPRYEVTPRRHEGFALFLREVFEGRPGV